MRGALVVASLALACCNTQLELVPPLSDGAVSDGDAAAAGAPCSGACADELTCFTMAGSATLPDGLCSRTCAAGTDCPSGMQCGTIEGVMLCLPACDPSAGVGCRSGYSCCSNQLIATGPGACAPPSSNFCGG